MMMLCMRWGCYVSPVCVSLSARARECGRLFGYMLWIRVRQLTPGILIYQFEAVNLRGETTRKRSHTRKYIYACTRQTHDAFIRACVFSWQKQHTTADMAPHTTNTYTHTERRYPVTNACMRCVRTIYVPSSYRTWCWWICAKYQVNR